MTEVRSRVRSFIFALTGLLLSLLFIRLILIFFDVNSSHALANFFYSLTDWAVFPFSNIATALAVGQFSLDINTLVSMAVWLMLGILLAGVITGFLYDNLGEILLNVVDAVFKVLEFILLVRFIFKLFSIQYLASTFTGLIYDNTAWASGLLPDLPFFGGRLELSTLLVLVIAVIIDLATERVVEALQEHNSKVKVEKVVTVGSPPSKAEAPKPAQNITINVPVPVSAQQKPASQVINIQAPPVAVVKKDTKEIKEG